MKLRITKLIMVAAIAAMVGIAGSTVAWGDELPPPCPTSPNYSPDFSNVANQACLTPNNNGAYAGYPGFYPVVNPPTPPPVVTTVLRLTPNATFAAGSAWYNTAQPVAGAFSTTFTFELSGGNTSDSPADGIAFVIQNSPSSPAPGALNALGPDGCGIGFGGDTVINCTPGGGIPNSLAVEFNTYYNAGIDPSNNDVTIQNCGGVGANSVDPSCSIGLNDLTKLATPINMADGNPHTVTISYTPSALSNCGPSHTATCSSLDVILDGTDLFPGGVLFDMTTIGLTSGNAYVGFTAATGGGDDNQDILSWTLTPGAQSGTATAGTTLDLNFAGGFANNGYDASTLLATGSPSFTVQVNPIVQLVGGDPTYSCNQLVQANSAFSTAQCFVYNNADGLGHPGTVMFEYTCPGSTDGGQCGSIALQNFIATLGSDFFFEYDNNSGLPMPALPPAPYEPLIGFLKGSGPDPLSPCTPYPSNSPPLFQSNQILSFTFPAGDPPGSGKASSAGTGSCWTLTYLTPGEAPSVNIVAPVNGFNYQQNEQDATTLANYTCNTVNKGSSTTGPYLTSASCSATDSPGGSVNNGAQFDTATLGPHIFTATVVDSAANSVSQTYTYNVVASTDLAIADLALPKVATGSNLTYAIGVGDLGNATALNVMVTDTLAPGSSFVSASGSNVACALVNKKVSCQKIPFPCASAGPSGPVSCTVGPIYPLSISSLNGAVIKVVVNVTAAAGTTLKNTATVSAANLDPKQTNSSSTASTTVTAH